MVSPVRVRVPPLLFSKDLQRRPLALVGRPSIECRFYHNHYHNGHSLEVPREEVVEAHGGLAVHGGADVGVGVGCLPHRGVPEHLRDQLQLLSILEHDRG
jgi:DNA-binding transcriptional LysR family regulator